MMTFEKHDLARWVNEYAGELYSWAYYKVSDDELAKDLVQDTFLAAVEKVNEFKGESSPKTWLFSILNYKIIDVYRKKVNKTVTHEPLYFLDFFDQKGSWNLEKRPKNWHDQDENFLDDIDFQLVLKDCLDALPEKWSVCVKLKYLTEKNGNEICQEVGVSPTNFWQIIHRAKLQLRDCVEKNWFQN
jgi:RNA polymerase sigma-70 factor (ECF subfamily)